MKICAARQISKVLLLVITSFLLYSCANMQGNRVSLRSPFNQDPSYYLQQASNSSATPDEQQTYLLQATAAYFYYGQFAQGRTTLYQLKWGDLNPLNAAQYQLLNARLALYDKKPERAMNILNSLAGNPNLTTQMQVESLKLQATAQLQLKLPIASIKTRILIEPLLTDPADQVTNQQMIWHIINHLPNTPLQNLAADDSNLPLQGWAALALTVHQYGNQPEQLIQHLKAWQNQFPSHPASALVSTDMGRVANWINSPKQVALLLPIKGKIAPQAQAIMNGFMAAFYQAKQQGLPAGNVKVYDTSQGNILDVYKRALNDGAAAVVGPLTKANVQALANDGDISVPTLALNNTNDASLPKNFYEFGLSPQQEAISVADRATQMGYTNAITISPSGAWGDNIRQAFSDRWQQDGGTVLSNLAYKPSDNLKAKISNILNISQSYQRRRDLVKVIGRPVKFSPRRRRDIDMIFINAQPQDARQILPLLRFYYAGNIPVYATSPIYSGIASPSRDTDLNGIRFTIMPWALNPSLQARQLRKSIMQLWSKSFNRFSLFYAFGIDAYDLMTRMGQLQAFPKFGFSGNTGTLTIGADARIHRQTEWAVFRKGKPKAWHFDNNVIIPLQTNDT